MSIFNELKRRNVFRVGIAYLIVAWLVMQVADVVINNIEAPVWVFQVIMLLLGIGLPVVLIFAWAFEMTPEGIKKEKDVDRSQSITSTTGRKLDYTIIGILVLVAGYFVWESRFSGKGSEPFSQETMVRTTQRDNEKRDPTPGNAAKANQISNNSIAVLPFANRSNVEDDMFFTDGIHDDLLTQLAKISDLRVISRTSVMEYRDTTKKIPEIAAELGVSTILEGGIQRAGNRIRINAQLIDVSTDEHLWAETFDREMTMENIFDIQSEITRQIVTAVRGELSDAESAVLSQLPTNNLKAYESYLHARAELNKADYTQEKFIAAESWLKKAVELDPQFALAWATLVGTNAQAVWSGRDETEDRHRLIRESLENATRLGPNLPETLAAKAEYLYRIENDYHEAEKAFRAASKAKPGDTDLLTRLALTLRRTGKFEESISIFQLASELDPATIWPRTLMVETLFNMREFERTELLVDRWMEKYPAAMDIHGLKVGVVIYHHGDLVAARKLLDQLEPWTGNDYYNHSTKLPFLEREFQLAIDVWDQPGMAYFTNDPTWATDKFLALSRGYGYARNPEMATKYLQMAEEAVKTASATNDANKAYYLQQLALVLSSSDQFATALEMSEKARQLMPESRDSLAGPDYSNTHAMIMAMAGQRDEALAEIKRLLNTPSGLVRWDLYLNPDWDFFRDDERFNELVRPLNLQEVGK